MDERKKQIFKALLAVSFTFNFAFTANLIKQTFIDDRDVTEYHFHASFVTEGGDSLVVSMNGDSVMVFETKSGKRWVAWWPMKVEKR